MGHSDKVYFIELRVMLFSYALKEPARDEVTRLGWPMAVVVASSVDYPGPVLSSYEGLP